MKIATLSAVVISLVMLAGCGTAKEKTAPCKRPANLTSFAADARHHCGPMHAVNNPAADIAAIGIDDPDSE